MNAKKQKTKQLKEKSTIKDWKELILKRGEVKEKKDTQQILHELRYGPLSC